MKNKNESKKGIIRGMSVRLAGIIAAIMVGLTPDAQFVRYANQNRVQDENNKGTDMEKKDIERIVDEELGISDNLSEGDRQLLIEKYVKEAQSHIGEISDVYSAKLIMDSAKQSGISEDVIPQGAKYAYNAEFFKWYKDQGLIEKNDGRHIPQKGNLVFFDLDGNPDLIDHMGIVIDYKDGKFSTVEGNTGIEGKVDRFPLKYNIGNNNNIDIRPRWFAKVPWDRMIKNQNFDRFIDEELGIGREISKEDRQLLKEKYEKAIYKYMYYQEAKQKLENTNTLNLTDKQIEVASKAYAYLKSEGVKDEQNIGTLVVMFLESGLRPYVTSHDGNFFGALQWSSNQIEKIQEFADRENEENGTDYKYTEIEIQMPYFFKGSKNNFVEDGKSIVESYNEQEFESGAKAATYLLKKYTRPDPKFIDYKGIEKVASAFEDAFEGRKTKAFKNAFERSTTTTAFENNFLENTTIQPKKSNVGEIFEKGIDR